MSTSCAVFREEEYRYLVLAVTVKVAPRGMTRSMTALTVIIAGGCGEGFRLISPASAVVVENADPHRVILYIMPRVPRKDSADKCRLVHAVAVKVSDNDIRTCLLIAHRSPSIAAMNEPLVKLGYFYVASALRDLVDIQI